VRHTTTTVLAAFVLGVILTLFAVMIFPLSLRSAFAQSSLSSVPIVPPLRQNISAFHNTIIGGRYRLDGVRTVDSTFKGVTFVYGGGAYKLENAFISGKSNVELTGAAANTATLLEGLGFVIKYPATSTQAIEVNTPKTEQIPRTTIKGDFVSPYDGKK
jgi:hypothetical protein